MSKLSREKQQSILDTFAKNKQYKATAKIEGVDPRTVKSVVRSQSKAYDVTSQSTPNTSARARVDVQDFRKMQQDIKIIKRMLMKSLTMSEVITRDSLTNKVRHWPINKKTGFLEKVPRLERTMYSGYHTAETLAAMKRHGKIPY